MARRKTTGRTEDVVLYYATRLKNSVNGNPRFRLATSDGDRITQSDASISYGVDNLPNGVLVTLHTTKAGRVWNIVKRWPDDVTALEDEDVIRALTMADIRECGDGDEFAPYPGDVVLAEMTRRWGPDALERLASVITGSHASPEDELRWLDEDPGPLVALARGLVEPQDYPDHAYDFHTRARCDVCGDITGTHYPTCAEITN